MTSVHLAQESHPLVRPRDDHPLVPTAFPDAVARSAGQGRPTAAAPPARLGLDAREHGGSHRSVVIRWTRNGG